MTFQRVRLKDVLRPDIRQVSVENGKSYPIVGVLNRGRGILTREGVTANSTKYTKLNSVRPGDVIYSKLKAFEGAITVVPAMPADAYASSEFPTFVCLENIDSSYMALLTQQPSLWAELALLSKGIGGRRERISPRDLLSIHILLPGLHEQRRTVDLIAALDDVIQAAQVEEVSALKVAAQLRIDAFGASMCPRTVIESLSDVSIGKQKNSNGTGSYPYIRAANLSGGRLSTDDLSVMPFTEHERQRMAVEYGDVLIVEGGGGYGQSAMWTSGMNGFVGMQNSIIRLRSIIGRSDPSYLLHWAKWARESGAFDDSMTSTTIPHLSLSRVKGMEIPDRDFETQRALMKPIDAASAVAEAAREHTDVLVDLRANLLGALLSGTHRIPETYDELLGADLMNAIGA